MGFWFCDCCINELPTDRFRLAAQVGDKFGPVAVAVGVRLDMAGAVGQDLAGLVQGVRILVDDGAVEAGVAVFGDLEQGIDAAGGLHHPVGGAPALGQDAEFVIGQADGVLRLFLENVNTRRRVKHGRFTSPLGPAHRRELIQFA